MSHELDQWTQEWKLLTVASPLGEDVFLLQRLSGREAISELFRFELDLISQDHCIDFDSMIGQSITVGIRLADGAKQRYINGLVSRFVQLPPEGRLARYSAEIVPRMWFLTRASDCRIYQQATAVEIIEDVFRRFEQPEKSFSWWDYRQGAFRRNMGLRIDLILASEALAHKCTACTIDPGPRKLERPSDHTPVVATFADD